MTLGDVNVLICAFREEMDQHSICFDWLNSQANSNESFGVSEWVLTSFVRVVTNVRIFKTPTPLSRAFLFCNALLNHPNAVRLTPGERYWEIFEKLSDASNARGNLIPDASFAALAIETGSDWVTLDRDFARFPGLRWTHLSG